MSREGKVYVQEKFAGIIKETEEGKFVFKYDNNYLESEEPSPVSLSLPLRKEPYISDFLFPFFDELIPEGWLLFLSLPNWKLNPNDRMGLLLAACEDCVGSVKVISNDL